MSTARVTKPTHHRLKQAASSKMNQRSERYENFASQQRARYAQHVSSEAGTRDYFRELLYTHNPPLRHAQPSTSNDWDAFVFSANQTANAFDWKGIGLELHKPNVCLATPMERFPMDSPTPWLDRLAMDCRKQAQAMSGREDTKENTPFIEVVDEVDDLRTTAPELIREELYNCLSRANSATLSAAPRVHRLPRQRLNNSVQRPLRDGKPSE